MKKIVLLMWIVLSSISCRAQILTDNYAAFERLIADVTSIVDSCLSCLDKDSISYYSVNFMMVVCLDSNGHICRAKLFGKNTPLKETQITFRYFASSSLFFFICSNFVCLVKLIWDWILFNNIFFLSCSSILICLGEGDLKLILPRDDTSFFEYSFIP